MIMRLADRVAIVTGSSLGIGKGIARRLLEEGAKVVINGRRADVLERTRAELASLGEVIAVAGDLGLGEDVERLFAATLERFGTLDVLVNNAAWADASAHFLEMSEEHWDTVMRSNLKSLYLCSHRAANLFVDQGKTGIIINISSFAGSRSHRNMVAYDASKGGMEAATRAMAVDLAPFGIRVNVVQPGAIHTEAFEQFGEEAKARRGATVPLGRVGYPADVAGAVVFLASDDARYITGVTLPVDGGMLAQLRSPQVDTPVPEQQLRRRRVPFPAL